VRDTSQLARQALQAAIRDSRPKAEAAAAAAGLTLGDVRAVVETPVGPPMARGQSGGAGGEGIAPGETQVSARVLVTYNVAPGVATPGTPNQSIAERRTSFTLTPVERSGVAGTVEIAQRGDRTSLSLRLNGLEPGKNYVAQIHAGTPGQLSASAGRLGEMTATAQGQASLTVTTVRASATGAAVDLADMALLDGEYTIVIQLQGSGIVAQAAVPPAATVSVE
jgi:hypothetical protein